MRSRGKASHANLIVVVLVGAAVGQACSDEKKPTAPSPKDDPHYIPFSVRSFGRARIVNLYVNPESPPRAFDVWLRTDTNEYGYKLPKSLEFGTATPWFRGTGARLVPAGTNGTPVKTWSSVLGERKNTFVYMGIGSHTGGIFMDVGEGLTKAPVPKPGKAAVLIFAKPLEAFGKEVERRFGTQAFRVGDGAGKCRPSRPKPGSAPGLVADTLVGRDGQVVVDVDPGTVRLSLHARECSNKPALVFDVALAAGEAAWALVYTRDGKTLEVLTLPVGRQ